VKKSKERYPSRIPTKEELDRASRHVGDLVEAGARIRAKVNDHFRESPRFHDCHIFCGVDRHEAYIFLKNDEDIDTDVAKNVRDATCELVTNLLIAEGWPDPPVLKVEMDSHESGEERF